MLKEGVFSMRNSIDNIELNNILSEGSINVLKLNNGGNNNNKLLILNTGTP
jgi:hypothetical protein